MTTTIETRTPPTPIPGSLRVPAGVVILRDADDIVRTVAEGAAGAPLLTRGGASLAGQCRNAAVKLLIRAVSRILLSLIIISASGCQVTAPARLTEPANSEAGEVEFDLAGPGGAAVVVPVKINGQGPYNFVMDTGATLTCVDQELARSLNLPERHGQIGVGATITSRGQIQLIGIDSLQVGTATGTDMLACRLDMQNVQALGGDIKGLLGLNFLKSFRVTLDFERKVLTLRKP